MKLHSPKVASTHRELFDAYKARLDELEGQGEEEQEEPFERSFLHNAIYLHNLWFEQLTEAPADVTSSPMLDEILSRRESDAITFQNWMTDFAEAAKPNGWVIWGWSYSLKTFVGCPIRGHDSDVPLGVMPILVIDCWEHAYIEDYGIKFDDYIAKFWKDLNWQVIETRHKELASLLGFGLK
jgi:superoxide dismutase, Fe-Mn family